MPANVPPESDASLAQMWRQVFQKTRAICQEEIRRFLGPNFSGGKLDGGALGGTVPPASLPIATTGALGVVEVGSGLSITTGGVLSSSGGSVMGASGSAHAVGSVPDPGATAGTTRYLREDATFAVPAGGGGGGGSLSPATIALTADVGINTGYTDVLTIALGVGTWLITASVHLYNVGASTIYSAKLWDGTTNYASGTGYGGGSNPASIALSAIVPLVASSTIRLAAAAAAGTSPAVKAQIIGVTAGNTATLITAIKVA